MAAFPYALAVVTGTVRQEVVARGGTVLADFGRYLHTRKPTTPKTNIPGTRVHSKITAPGYSMDISV